MFVYNFTYIVRVISKSEDKKYFPVGMPRIIGTAIIMATAKVQCKN